MKYPDQNRLLKSFVILVKDCTAFSNVSMLPHKVRTSSSQTIAGNKIFTIISFISVSSTACEHVFTTFKETKDNQTEAD